MNILVLNGSPRPGGNTKRMIEAFREGAEAVGNTVEVIDVGQKQIGGCRGCEYCHTKGHGQCIQKDDMQQVYAGAGPDRSQARQDLRPGGAAISHPKRNCRDPEIRPSGTDAAESGQPEFYFGRHGADQPPGWRTLPVWVVLK